MNTSILRHHAQKYFRRKLFLNPQLSSDNKSKPEDVGEGTISDHGSASIESKPKVNRKMLIDKANGILSNFPIEKSMFSPNRKHLPTQSIFEDLQDPDKLINSLLFSTKLIFFDSSKTSSDIINEVSADSFGYINILRNNQISIMEKELLQIKKQQDFLESDEIKSKLENVKRRRDNEIADRNGYLEEALFFYAEYVMGSGDTKNIDKLKAWLDKKVEDNKR